MIVMKILLTVLAATGLLCAADVKLGKPLAIAQPVALSTLLAHPGDYTGKTVQVKGKIVEVCQMMGCWLDLANEDGQKVHIKVEDGVIEFPKDSAGKTVIAEGEFTKVKLTREEAVARAQEEAKDKGRKFDPASVKGPVTIYEIHGTGAVILSN
jgi:hypothetical protein